MNQTNYNDNCQKEYVPEIIAPNEPHMALVMLTDTSGSMNFCHEGKSSIEQLNDGLNNFKTGVMKDPRTRDILDYCHIAFDHEAHLIQDWCPIEQMNTVSLTAGGGTAFVPALRLALDKVSERTAFYRETIGPNFFKPWVVMITDGRNENGPSVDTIVSEVRGLDDAGKFKLWTLGVDNYDGKDLHKLTDRVIKLRDHDFSSFLDWVGKSMIVLSHSSPTEKTNLPLLPNNADKDVNNYA